MSIADSQPALPDGPDLDRPSVARIYDFYLGGTANWAIDREFGKRALATFPLLRPIAKANRLFLHRAVRYLVRQGVTQFIDIGAGVPTMGNTHQVADQVSADSRVVYVDNEPVAVAHSEMLLDQYGDDDRHAVVHADLRDPDHLWHRVAQTGVIDLDQPVAVLLIAVLHVYQEGPDGADIGAECVARYRELLPSGSCLAISHLTDDGVPERLTGGIDEMKNMYAQRSSSSVVFRDRAQIAALFGDFTMEPPGLTWTPLWHPEETGSIAPVVSFASPAESLILAGVGRKP